MDYVEKDLPVVGLIVSATNKTASSFSCGFCEFGCKYVKYPFIFFLLLVCEEDGERANESETQWMFPYVIVIVFCEKINCLVLSVAYRQGYYAHCGAVATSSSYPMTLSIIVQCLKTEKKKTEVIAFSPSRVETIGR